MPSRIIREGWLESEPLNQLDAAGERFFLRLCLRADDYGRYHANPVLLKSNLFPLREDVRCTDIPRWLAACEKAGLVRCYQAEAKAFLEIVKFGQRTRAEKSKFPAPPADDGQMPDKCPAYDGPPRTYSYSESKSDAYSETLGKTMPAATCAAEAAPTSPEVKLALVGEEPAKPAKPAKTTEAEWLAGLAADSAFAGIDVPREHAKAARWCMENGKQLTRRRFVNWLNRADKPMSGAAHTVRDTEGSVRSRAW
jgi:hypothetical protein